MNGRIQLKKKPQTFAALACILLCATAFAIYRSGQNAGIWPVDGYIYLGMTLRDRGMSERQAWDSASGFMRATEEGRENPALFSKTPPQFFVNQRGLFKNRPLYPAIAAAVPMNAPDALKAVSGVAYGIAIVLTFIVMLEVMPPWAAFLGSLAFANVPAVYRAAGLPLTDELALVFWIAAFGALLAVLERPSRINIAALGVVCLMLTFTRPAIYLPAAAAFAALIAARTYGIPPRAAWAAFLTVAAAAAVFWVYSSATGGATLRSELIWDYRWQQSVHGDFADRSFLAWWTESLLRACQAAASSIYATFGLFTLLLAAAAFPAARRSRMLPAAAGALFGSAAALFANPFDFAVERTMTIPASPIILLLAAYAFAAIASRLRVRLQRTSKEAL